MEKILVKVAAKSVPGRVAGYLAHLFEDDPLRTVDVRSMGARANEKATRSVTIAGQFLEGRVDLVTESTTVTVEGDRPAVLLIVSGLPKLIDPDQPSTSA